MALISIFQVTNLIGMRLMSDKVFVDSNIFLYLLSDDDRKKDTTDLLP